MLIMGSSNVTTWFDLAGRGAAIQVNTLLPPALLLRWLLRLRLRLRPLRLLPSLPLLPAAAVGSRRRAALPAQKPPPHSIYLSVVCDMFLLVFLKKTKEKF